MKIFCIGPFQIPSNALGRTRALERLGHSVSRFDTGVAFGKGKSLFARISRRLFFPVYRGRLLKQILSAAKANPPDLVFFDKTPWITLPALRRLKAVLGSSTPIVHYNPDDPFGSYGTAAWRSFIKAIPSFDLHVVPREENVEEYWRHGAGEVRVIDRSYDPEMHHPVELTPEDLHKYGCEVGFIGTRAPMREASLAHLAKSGVPLAIWGRDWEKGQYWEVLRRHWRGSAQKGVDYCKAICGMRIALHFLRHENRDLQDSRTFEIPACGSFMLAERSSKHLEFFEEGREAEFFSTDEELLEKVQRYRKDGLARKRIAEAGHQRCLTSGYSSDDRMRQILEWSLEEVGSRWSVIGGR